MVYKISVLMVVISVFFEVMENLFPIKNMNVVVRSYSRIVMLYLVCRMIFDIF